MSAPPLSTAERRFLTIREFCAACGISKATFYRLAAADKAPPITRLMGRSLIRVEAAEEWAEEQELKTADAPLKPRGRAAHPTLAEMLSGRAR
jgi:predicted DNA-binding transcriptional regulator AlpA